MSWSSSSTLATLSFLFLVGSFNLQLRRLFLSVSAMSIVCVRLLDGRGQRDLFLVTTLRYAASDNFNYLRGSLTLLPSVFSWAPDWAYEGGLSVGVVLGELSVVNLETFRENRKHSHSFYQQLILP